MEKERTASHGWNLGPDGIKLYLDGKLAAEDEFKGGPKQFAKTFSINNVEPEKVGNFASKCIIDEVRLSDHQKNQMS